MNSTSLLDSKPIGVIGAGNFGSAVANLLAGHRKVLLYARDKDVVHRMLPYLLGDISQDLREGKTVLVAAHGNSIRAIVKHIACISDEEIAEVNIPTGIPLLFNFDDDFEPIVKRGEYLDPEAAKAAIEAVANQGKK